MRREKLRVQRLLRPKAYAIAFVQILQLIVHDNNAVLLVEHFPLGKMLTKPNRDSHGDQAPRGLAVGECVGHDDYRLKIDVLCALERRVLSKRKVAEFWLRSLAVVLHKDAHVFDHFGTLRQQSIRLHPSASGRCVEPNVRSLVVKAILLWTDLHVRREGGDVDKHFGVRPVANPVAKGEHVLGGVPVRHLDQVWLRVVEGGKIESPHLGLTVDVQKVWLRRYSPGESAGVTKPRIDVTTFTRRHFDDQALSHIQARLFG